MSDSTSIIEFTVIGEPKAQPRVRATVRPGKNGKAFASVYNPDTNKAWKASVRREVKAAFKGRPPYVGPVKVTIDAFFDRPAWLDFAGCATEAIPMIDKPDRDNLDKAILDVMTECGVWHDDCQVCQGPVRKWWAPVNTQAGARIKVEEVPIDARVLEVIKLRRAARQEKALKAKGKSGMELLTKAQSGSGSGGGGGGRGRGGRGRIMSKDLAAMGVRVRDPYAAG